VLVRRGCLALGQVLLPVSVTAIRTASPLSCTLSVKVPPGRPERVWLIALAASSLTHAAAAWAAG
jgi:hypothetical protein